MVDLERDLRECAAGMTKFVWEWWYGEGDDRKCLGVVDSSTIKWEESDTEVTDG